MVPGIFLVRGLGWLLLAASVFAPLAALAVMLAGGPPHRADLALSPRLIAIFARTLAIAGGATVLAFLLAVPACFARTHAHRRLTRGLLSALTLMPLVAPPCVFGYAWMLLATQPHPLGRLLATLGFNSESAAPIRAAVALASWLWPVPALILAWAYAHGGRGAYRLARLDTAPLPALLRAALPAMAPSLLAAAAIVFLLAINDGTIPPLVLARTWPAEVAPETLDAALYGTPAAAVFWKSWPVLLALLAVVLLSLPGIRQWLTWSGMETPVDLGGGRLRGGAIHLVCAALTVLAGLFPILVFVADLYSARLGLAPALRRCWTLYAVERNASLLVAALTAGSCVVIALAVIRLPATRRRSLRASASRIVGGAALAGALVLAVLPPELLGYVFVLLFDRPGFLGRIYDATPLAWLAAMIARFGFIPLSVAAFAAHHIPHDQLHQGRSDGADEPRLLARVALPHLLRPLFASAFVCACLALSEVAASFILIPPRFGGSLAVAVDNQMHYGRNNDLIVTTLMLLTPPTLCACVLPFLFAEEDGRA